MTKPTENHSNPGDTLGRNSLKHIKGIGNVKQGWLRRILNIRTIEELAAASAQEIEEELRQAGHPIHQTEIRDWIDQAKVLLQQEEGESIVDAELAAELSRGVQSPQDPDPPSLTPPSPAPASLPTASLPTTSLPTEWSRTEVTELSAENGNIGAVGAVGAIPSGNPWQPIVALTVQVDHRISGRGIEYRSIIKHQHSVQTHTWTGMDLQQGQEWMLQHLHDLMQDVIHNLMQLPPVIEQQSSPPPPASTIKQSLEPRPAEHLTSIEAPKSAITESAITESAVAESAVPVAPSPQEPSVEVPPLPIPSAPQEISQSRPNSVSEATRAVPIADSSIESSAESSAESTVPPPRVPVSRVGGIALVISQLKVFQPPFLPEGVIITRQSRILPQALSSQQPFAVEVHLQLAGQDATAMTQQPLSYGVHAVIHDRDSGELLALDLTRSGILVDGIFTYTALLPEMTLQPGLYRLRVLAELQEGVAQPGSFNVPLLQVI